MIHLSKSPFRRSCCIAASFILSLTLGGIFVVNGWSFGPFPANTESNAKPKTAPHTPPTQMLARTLRRLHGHALQHFYSDPTNGLRRMPVVYHKVVKEWHEPYFSPGEVDEDQPIPFLGELANIHKAGVNDFINPKSSPNPAFALRNSRFNFPRQINYKNFKRDQKVWEAKTVDLVGLLKHPDPVVYISEQLSAKPNPRKAPTRYLDTFELAGLDALERGQDLFARTDKGIVRLLGAVRADASCLKCHEDKKAGDLLGAFSYTLRQAEYRQHGRRPVIQQRLRNGSGR